MDRFTAGVDLIGRDGSKQFEFRLSEPETPGSPEVFVCLAEFSDQVWAVGGGISPNQAMDNLLDYLIDGGKCQHCGRTTGVVHEPGDPGDFAAPICWYAYDPELKTYRRSCEGETAERKDPSPCQRAFVTLTRAPSRTAKTGSNRVS